MSDPPRAEIASVVRLAGPEEIVDRVGRVLVPGPILASSPAGLLALAPLLQHAGEMTSTLHIEEDGPVTVVTVDRPGRRNAIDPDTAEALLDAFLSFEADEAASVAVLTGRGGTFCAGADLKAVAEGARYTVGEEGPGPLGPTHLVLGKPVIAAIEGYAVAGGLELALWCDLRVAADDAALGVFCRRFGIPLIDGGTVRLPRLIGQGRALDLILTGREVGASEALGMGLVDRVVPAGTALDAAVVLGQELAALPQACLRNDRMSALTQWGLSTADALRHETRWGLKSLSSPDAAAGAARFEGGAGRSGSAVVPGTE
jgi:enoyl-CoA hydratase